MKKQFIKILKTSLILIAIAAPVGLKASNITSQTYLMPRTLTEDSVYQLGLNGFEITHNNYNKKPYTWPRKRAMIAYQSIIAYQESKNDEDLAEYFLLANKKELTIDQDSGGDIAAQWVGLDGINDSYNKKFSIRPRRKVLSAALSYQQDLSKMVNGLCIDLFLPIVQVQHYIRFNEFGQREAVSATSTFTTIEGALSNQNWQYGRFYSDKKRIVGLDDFQIKLGWNILTKYNRSHVGIYGDILLPMGDSPKADFIFEPMIGNGGHFGLGCGAKFDWAIMNGHRRNIFVVGDFKYRYLFSSTEKRSFDLVNNGQWSRYLKVSKYDGTYGVEDYGINHFTRDLKITPQGRLDLLLALHGQFSDFNIELGYNLWAKQKEKVRLKTAWETNVENIGLLGNDSDHSASAATINTYVRTNDATFTKITQADLNLGSAACKSATTNKVYGGLSFNYKCMKRPCMIGFGGSYEFANNTNKAIEQWATWFKASLSF